MQLPLGYLSLDKTFSKNPFFLLNKGMHRKSMEVAQHYNNNDSSEPESSSDFTENNSPKKSMQHLIEQQNSLMGSNPSSGGTGNGMPEQFAAAAAAAAAAAMASEDFRSHSIAALRARAQQHSASLRHSPNSSSHLIHDWNTQPPSPPTSITPNTNLPPEK